MQEKVMLMQLISGYTYQRQAHRLLMCQYNQLEEQLKQLQFKMTNPRSFKYPQTDIPNYM